MHVVHLRWLLIILVYHALRYLSTHSCVERDLVYGKTMSVAYSSPSVLSFSSTNSNMVGAFQSTHPTRVRQHIPMLLWSYRFSRLPISHFVLSGFDNGPLIERERSIGHLVVLLHLRWHLLMLVYHVRYHLSTHSCVDYLLVDTNHVSCV